MSSHLRKRYRREGLGRRGIVPPELQNVPAEERTHLSKKNRANGEREWAGMTAREDEPEFFCVAEDGCGSRITVSPCGKYEYGHDRGRGGWNRVCQILYSDYRDGFDEEGDSS